MLIYAVLSIFPLLGLLMLGYGARNVWRGVASVNWPRAAGIVIASGGAGNTGTDTESNYASMVTVGYKVNGQEYQTSTMQFGVSDVSSDPSELEMARLRYPKGAEVPVAYHPQNPDLAALKPGFATEALLMPACGIAVMLMGIMAVLGVQSAHSPGRHMITWILRLFGAIFMLVGMMLIIPGVRRIVRGSESLSWPKAPGVILFSQVTSSTSVDTDSDGNSSTSTTYNTPLLIEYEVNGRKHYSNTRAFGRIAGSGEKWAAEIAERYPTGKKVQVAYSPADPDEGVLEPGFTSEAYWLPGAGAVCFLFGLIAAVVIRF